MVNAVFSGSDSVAMGVVVALLEANFECRMACRSSVITINNWSLSAPGGVGVYFAEHFRSAQRLHLTQNPFSPLLHVARRRRR